MKIDRTETIRHLRAILRSFEEVYVGYRDEIWIDRLEYDLKEAIKKRIDEAS